MNFEGHLVYWWTGGTDIGREGNWTWVSSQEAVGDFLWYSGQPNDGIIGNCLYLQTGSYEGYDYSCTSQLYPICQLNV